MGYNVKDDDISVFHTINPKKAWDKYNIIKSDDGDASITTSKGNVYKSKVDTPETYKNEKIKSWPNSDLEIFGRLFHSKDMQDIINRRQRALEKSQVRQLYGIKNRDEDKRGRTIQLTSNIIRKGLNSGLTNKQIIDRLTRAGHNLNQITNNPNWTWDDEINLNKENPF